MNLQEGNPIIGRDRTTAIENAVTADEIALGQSTTNVNTFCDVQLSSLAAPLNTTVAIGGTAGSTSLTYVVADTGNAGTFAPASGVTNTAGNATLSPTNTALISWASIVGHTYNVYRTAGGAAQGLIGTVTATALSSSLLDTGLTATTTSGNSPSANTTGALKTAGPIYCSQLVYIGANVQTVSTTANATLTPANVLNGLCVLTGGAALTFTLPTAATLVAALPGVQVNSSFRTLFRNTNSGSATLAVSTGATSASGNTLATISLHTKEVFIQFTNVTAGSEAYTVYTALDTAY